MGSHIQSGVFWSVQNPPWGKLLVTEASEATPTHALSPAAHSWAAALALAGALPESPSALAGYVHSGVCSRYLAKATPQP